MIYLGMPCLACEKHYNGIYDCSDGATMFYWSDATEDMLHSYATQLEELGYTKHQELDNACIHSATYYREQLMMHVYYLKKTAELRVIVQADAVLPINAYPYERLCDVAVTQLGTYNDPTTYVGMGYLIRLEDGTFVVIDGGQTPEYDSKLLYDTMLEQKPDGIDDIVISAWIITHDYNGVNSYKGFMYDQNWPYNTVDVMNYLPKTSGTASTVTFTWTGNTCVVNGTPTGNAWNYLVNYSTDPIPPMLKPGEKYYLHFEQGGGGNVAFAIVWRSNGSAIRRDYCYNDTEITAPSAFDAVSIALVVFNGHTANSETITCRLFSVSGATKVLDSDVAEMKEALKDIMPRNVLLDFGNFATGTSHEVTFTWDGDHENCIVNGTAESGASYAYNTIWAYTDGLPEEIKPGRQYNLVYSASDANKVAAHIYYLLPEEQTTNTRYFGDATITIPDDCIGITVRLDVASGVTCDNVAVKLQLMSIGVETVSGGVANHVSKMFSIGSSFMTGWIYKHNEETGTATKDHVCSFDNSPYGNVAIGLGIEQEHVNHILMESTGLLKVVYQSKGNILNRLLATDLSPYDYVLTQYNRNDLGTGSDPGFPLGDLNSPASDTTIVGAVKTLVNYMKTNAPNATLILVGAPPSAQTEEYRGANVFTAKYNNGVSIGEANLMMHRLAVQEHFIFIDWEDLNLSYYYYTLCDDGNVHPRDDATCRMMGMYLARQCNYTTSIVKVMKADLEG